MAALSAYDMFSWYKYLIVNFFSHLGIWSGNLFLIAPVPDRCLLVPFYQTFVQTSYFEWFSGHTFGFIFETILNELKL